VNIFDQNQRFEGSAAKTAKAATTTAAIKRATRSPRGMGTWWDLDRSPGGGGRLSAIDDSLP